MRCELCTQEIPKGLSECPQCSNDETKIKIRSLLEETIQSLSESPRDPKERSVLYFHLGNFYRLCGRYDEAIGCYEKATSEEGAKHECFHLLGTVLAAKRDYKSAVESMRKAVESAPNYPDYHNDLGAAYFKAGKYEEAAASFKEAIRLNSGYANAHNNLGLVYRKKRMHLEAEHEIRKAIELDPAHAIATYDLGLSYFSGGMFSQLRSALEIDSKTLGDIYRIRGLYPAAIEQYEKTIQIHPQYADVLCLLGQVYVQSGNKKKGESYFRKALDINPKFETAKLELTKITKGGEK